MTDPIEHGLRSAVQAVLWNASNYPKRAQAGILGSDIGPLTAKVVAAVRPSGWAPLPAPSDDEREAIAMIVKRTNAKWAGPSMAEFANDPPTRTHYSIADQVLAYLAARRSPVQADTPSDEEIAAAASIALPVSGATQSGTAVQSGRNFRGAERVAFAAGARWALASRPTPPEDVAALIAEGWSVGLGPKDAPDHVDQYRRLIYRLAAALAARTDTASESPSDLELPVEMTSPVGASEDVAVITDEMVEAGAAALYDRTVASMPAAAGEQMPPWNPDSIGSVDVRRDVRAVLAAALAARPAPERDDAVLTVRPIPPTPSDAELRALYESARALPIPGLAAVWRHGCDAGMVALIDEAERYAAAHESQPGGAWSGTAVIIRRLIAALAARPLPEPEQWEYASALVAPDGTYWDEEITSLAEARRHVAECDGGEDHDDPCVVVKRTPERPPGPWLPVPSADLGEESGRG